MLSLLIVLAAQTGPEVRVIAPAKPNEQVPATLTVEPAAMLIVACDADADGRTARAELESCLARSFGERTVGYLDFADWQRKWLGDQGALPSPFEVDRSADDRIFNRLDKDADGGVTRSEALTLRALPTADPNRRGKRRAERVPGVPGGTPEPPDPNRD
jgi:hypothetical protein